MPKIVPVFPVDEDLKIREEFIGIHAMNPFFPEVSSARGYMSSSHFSQDLTIINGDEKIIQTGLEKQFGKNTFSCKVDTDSRVLKIVERYNGVSINAVNALTETILITEDIRTGEIDYVNIPYHFSLHQYYGFEYKRTDALNDLTVGTVLKANTILADSPTITENSGYRYGVNANIALMSIPETAEDGVVISKSMAEKLSYKLFEKRVVEFGTDTFPLNIYGDEKHYKGFPEIGEMINDDSVLMVLRTADPELAPALCSVNDVRKFNPVFDKAIYVRSPGSVKEILGEKVRSGVVVDIKAYNSPKFKKDLYTETANDVMKYVTGYKKYYEDIVNAYEAIKNDHYRRFKDRDLNVSEKFQRLLIDAFAIVNQDNSKIAYSFRNEPLDIIRMEFTICYTLTAIVGSKISDGYGSKGVVIEVREDNEMPVDIYGNRAHVIMDPTSLTSRMNPGRIYEVYFNAMSRHAKQLVINALKLEKLTLPASNTEALPLDSAYLLKPLEMYDDAVINNAYDTALGLLRILETEQLDYYSAVTLRSDKENILKEIIEKEFFILYKVSSKKKPYQVVLEASDTPYEPIISSVLLTSYGEIKETKDPVMIAPIYTIILAKSADNFLSSPSAKTNHYGLPIGVGNSQKYNWPWKNNPVKNISETEMRLYRSYGSALGVAELCDRAKSLKTHASVYLNILNAPKPTNINRVVDRAIVPYGEDAAMALVNNIFMPSGIETVYVPDTKRLHPAIRK